MIQTVHAPQFDEPAPDGSTVFPLVRTSRASAGVIYLDPGQTSAPVEHRSIEEIWYVLDGRGELWRCLDEDESTVSLEPGVCVTIPTGCRFQFRSSVDSPLEMLMVTVPPWPGDAEVIPSAGPWEPTVT